MVPKKGKDPDHSISPKRKCLRSSNPAASTSHSPPPLDSSSEVETILSEKNNEDDENSKWAESAEEGFFFGQLSRVLLLELPLAPKLDLAEPTTLILAVIQEVKAKLTDGIYYYKNFGLDEVVDLETIQCVVERIQDRGKWALIDRSSSVTNNVDWGCCKFFLMIFSIY